MFLPRKSRSQRNKVYEHGHQRIHMKAIRLVWCCLFGMLLCPSGNCQEEEIDKSFPKNEEIRLLVTQTDRAVTQYEKTIDLEATLLGGDKAVANDRRIILGLKTFVTALTKTPQKFNGPETFQLILMLDDASRNASLCYGESIQQGLNAVMSHTATSAEQYLILAQSCSGVSNSFYSVSENATALYQRYVNWLSDTADQAVKTMNDCVETLKKTPSK